MRRGLLTSLLALWMIGTLFAENRSADSVMLDAYRQENMTVWREYIDSNDQRLTTNDLLYLYGYCGYIVAEAKKEGQETLLPKAKRYVQHFKSQITDLQSQLPAGHFEMYLSAVYVYELRLHESIHPLRAMSLAREAVRLAPDDPLVLSYYATCLFYAPKPFGSKRDALRWFEQAAERFGDERWRYCWVREATDMYIRQCHDKLRQP